MFLKKYILSPVYIYRKNIKEVYISVYKRHQIGKEMVDTDVNFLRMHSMQVSKLGNRKFEWS